MPELVLAADDVLERVLDETFPLWGEGLSRRAYAQWNLGQMRTPWGSRHLRRFALVDGAGVLASAKRYDLIMRVDGAEVPTLGIGAVFTPPSARGRGHAASIVAALEQAAARDGARLALLFSEIGPAYYERLGFGAVPVQTMDIDVRRGQGAPAMMVRAGEERDASQVAAMMVERASAFRLALWPDAEQVAYSVARKRLFAGLDASGRRRVEYFVAEEGQRAVAFVLLHVSHGVARAPEVWSLEACGDRDPSGARIGAILQVLVARQPAAGPSVIRGWWPASLGPPQLRLTARPPAGEVMMVKSLDPNLRPASFEAGDILYWHGDAF
jgi:GNAT superfamily N-acetyltransferase